MNRPKVSVVCLSFNHRRFVQEAIESVLAQSYPHVELILVDDASTDGSQALVASLATRYPHIRLVQLAQNEGNCRAFNRGLALATGDLIIDFAADDVMLPDRIEKQVQFFVGQSDRIGVVFTDATYISDIGAVIRHHYDHLFKKKLIDHVPQGDVFRAVLTRYFICGPTMMVRREVFQQLKGYDETLSYEDFDFWVRASREFEFAFLNERLTLVRKTARSMSAGWYRPGDPQLASTARVCEKAMALCRDELDRQALRQRLLYEFRQALFSGNRTEAGTFQSLLKSFQPLPFSYYFLKVVATFPLPWPWIRATYQRVIYD